MQTGRKLYITVYVLDSNTIVYVQVTSEVNSQGCFAYLLNIK